MFFIGKIIKLIFKIIGIIMLILILLPIILLIIMYKGYEAPVDDFASYPTGLSFTDIAQNRLDAFLDASDNPGSESTATFDFTITEAEANVALKDLYAANNPNFGSTDTNVPEDQRKYAFSFGIGGFKGATASFYEGGMMVEAGAEVSFYQTTLMVDLKFDIDADVYKLTVADIKIGNLPILWMYDLASWGFGIATGSDLNTMLEDMVPFGEFDAAKKSFTITGETLANLVSGDNAENSGLIKALLAFITDAELLESGFEEDQGGISLALGKMFSSKTQYNLVNQITTEAELNALLEGQLSSILVSSLLNNEPVLNYDMHEVSFNQLLDYYIGDAMNITEDIEFGTKTYVLQTQPLFARFINNKLHLTIIMSLTGDTGVFKTDFTLIATPSVSENGEDLVFTINSVNIGEDLELAGTPEKVSTILGLIPSGDGSAYSVDGDKLILKEFLKDVQGNGVTVESISITGSYLRFVLTPDGEAASVLEELQDVIDTILDTVTDNPDFQDVNDALQDYLADPENTDPMVILDAINDLTLEQQQELFDNLLDALDSIDGLEDLLP